MVTAFVEASATRRHVTTGPRLGPTLRLEQVMAMEGALPAVGLSGGDEAVRSEVNAAVVRAYTEHYVSVARLAYLLVGDRTQAEDLAHEAFARLHAKYDRLKDKDRALAYLRTTVVNQARSAGR